MLPVFFKLSRRTGERTFVFDSYIILIAKACSFLHALPGDTARTVDCRFVGLRIDFCYSLLYYTSFVS